MSPHDHALWRNNFHDEVKTQFLSREGGATSTCKMYVWCEGRESGGGGWYTIIRVLTYVEWSLMTVTSSNKKDELSPVASAKKKA